MIDFKLTGVSDVALSLDARQIIRYPEIDKIVQRNAQVLVNQIVQNYIAEGHRKTGNLIRSIMAFRRKKKKDGWFTYYVGPRYGQGGGNHAHFLEFGVLYSAYPIQGQGATINGRKYGKFSTKQGYRIAPTGTIRRSRDQKEAEILKGLEDDIIEELLNQAKKKGFEVK